MYKNKDFEGQLVRLFRVGRRFRIESLYGAILSRSKVLNRKLVRSYFKSVEG
jgi:hypothetical protein